MRLRTEVAVLLVLLSTVAASGEQNQHRTTQQASQKQASSKLQLLRPEDGLAVLSAALETRQRYPHADCSHLVHAIYQRAGLPYTYAPSRDLYAGSGEFARVSKPQAGDLIVWPGHVGIVISPKEHSFYSALRSGLRVKYYDSAYWKRRGQPHFVRYVTEERATSVASTREYPDESPKLTSLNPTVQRATFPVSRPESATTNDLPISEIQVFDSSRPSSAQLKDAALRAFTHTQEQLQTQNLLQLRQSLVFFDEFEIRKVHIKDDRGWAEVRISGPSSLSAGRATLKKHSEQARWPLTMTAANTWSLAPPVNIIYLSREAGTRIVARQLASLTENTTYGQSIDQKSELAHLLAALLDQ